MILIACIFIVLLRMFYSVAEVCFERDWPRSTWRGLAVSLGLLMLCASAFGQAALRYDSSVWTIYQAAPVPGGFFPVIVAPGSQVSICNAPVGGVSCVTLATTYNESAEDAVCPTTAPMTRPNSQTCVSNAGPEGDLGVWVGAGCYQWVATTSYGQSTPQDFCVGASGAAGITQLTGDVLAGPGSGSQAATLATVNSGPGTCGDATHVCAVTTNGKGLVTNQSATPITFPSAGIYYQTVLTGNTVGTALPQQLYLAIGPGLVGTNGVPVGSIVGRTIISANTTASNTTFDPYVAGSPGAGTAGTYAVWDTYGGVTGGGTSRTSGTNGFYSITPDGTITEWITTGTLNNNTPTTVTIPFAIPTAVMSITCTDNGGRVQSGNDQPVGANVVGLSAPFSTIYVNTPSTTVSAYCTVVGY